MRRFLFIGFFVLLAGSVTAPAQTTGQSTPDQAQTEPINAGPGQVVPVYKTTVVGSTVPAINYRHRSGTTKLEFRGTSLLATAHGSAEVRSEAAATHVNAEFKHLPPASTLGPEYLTFVLWAISPDGRPLSLGEIAPNNEGNAHVDVTTPLQAFGLVVTAEPYFSVTRPATR